MPRPRTTPEAKVELVVTKRLSFRIGEEGSAGSSCPWTVFASAVHQVAAEIPAGCNPTVSNSHGVIYVTWDEPAVEAAAAT